MMAFSALLLPMGLLLALGYGASKLPARRPTQQRTLSDFGGWAHQVDRAAVVTRRQAA
jgi:hypothetical protein